MPVGRPLKFESPEALQKQVDAYFADCDKTKRPYTITGLAYALDTTRETLLDYEDKELYSDTIKRAKLKCQRFAEEFLFTGKNATGSIFNLKNNYGWRDKQEVDSNNTGELTINIKKFGNGTGDNTTS